MLIVIVNKNDNIEKSLKLLKSKVISTKQQKKLFERKEYIKKSVKKRTIIQNAKYRSKNNYTR